MRHTRKHKTSNPHYMSNTFTTTNSNNNDTNNCVRTC